MVTTLCNLSNACLLLAILLARYNGMCGAILVGRADVLNDNDTTRPETVIPQGTLRGKNMTTRYDRTIFGFVGVPFAQPPVGDLRFKAPVPADPWNGTLDASADSEPCPQLNDAGVIIGDEDCLYLNVYTPQMPASDNSTLLPVMVFIVGGGFVAEIISHEQHSPQFLLDKDVLLVLPNYRVGALGYLTTGDEIAPGNYGLKDVVCALKWVQENIRYFGGDPNQVTLFGSSAGAMSIHLLTLSNIPDGLFHRYITQSGSALGHNLNKPIQVYVNRAIRLGEHFGCPTNTSTLLVNCLRGLTAAQLVDLNSLFYVWRSFPANIFLPTVEPDIEGALLTDTPRNLFAAGKIRDLPWLANVVRDEGLLYTIDFYKDSDYFEDFLRNIDLSLPWMLEYESTVDDVAAYTASLRSFYLNDLTADRSILLSNLTKLWGDVLYIYPTYSGLQQQLLLAESPRYFGCFAYHGVFSFSYFYTGTTGYKGIVHGDENVYLFGGQGTPLGPAEAEFSDSDFLMADQMVQLWTSFATNGTPTLVDSDSSFTWQPYSSLNNYLRIGNASDTGIALQYDLYLERMQFWDQLTATTNLEKVPTSTGNTVNFALSTSATHCSQ